MYLDFGHIPRHTSNHLSESKYDSYEFNILPR